MIFSFAGGLGMTLLAYRVFLRPTAQYPVGQLNPAGYAHYGIAAAAIMFVAILIFGGRHPPAHSLARRRRPRRASTLRQTLGEMAATLSNRSFLTMLVSGLFTAIGSGVIGGLYLYLMTFYFAVSTNDLSWLLLPSAAGGLAGPAMASAVSRRIGKKLAAISLEGLALLVIVHAGAAAIAWACSRRTARRCWSPSSSASPPFPRRSASPA